MGIEAIKRLGVKQSDHDINEILVGPDGEMIEADPRFSVLP